MQIFFQSVFRSYIQFRCILHGLPHMIFPYRCIGRLSCIFFQQFFCHGIRFPGTSAMPVNNFFRIVKIKISLFEHERQKFGNCLIVHIQPESHLKNTLTFYTFCCDPAVRLTLHLLLCFRPNGSKTVIFFKSIQDQSDILLIGHTAKCFLHFIFFIKISFQLIVKWNDLHFTGQIFKDLLFFFIFKLFRINRIIKSPDRCICKVIRLD